MQDAKPIQRAEKAIAEIVKALELECGAVVRSLSIEYIDVTMLDDEKSSFIRKVVIDMNPTPGSGL